MLHYTCLVVLLREHEVKLSPLSPSLCFQVWFKNRRARRKRQRSGSKVKSPSPPRSVGAEKKFFTSFLWSRQIVQLLLRDSQRSADLLRVMLLLIQLNRTEMMHSQAAGTPEISNPGFSYADGELFVLCCSLLTYSFLVLNYFLFLCNLLKSVY